MKRPLPLVISPSRIARLNARPSGAPMLRVWLDATGDLAARHRDVEFLTIGVSQPPPSRPSPFGHSPVWYEGWPVVVLTAQGAQLKTFGAFPTMNEPLQSGVGNWTMPVGVCVAEVMKSDAGIARTTP